MSTKLQYQTQLSLIKHLQDGITDNYSSVKPASVKAYAGEMRKMSTLNDVKPAILVMHIESKPLAETPHYIFDGFIVTDSASYDREANYYNNIEISAAVANYILENPQWTYENKPFLIDTEELSVKTYFQDNQFTVLILRFVVRNLK